MAATIADTNFFQVAAKYTIGPVRLFAGYEYIDYANPSNPLAPGAFIQGGYTIFAPNNTNFTTDKIVQTVWFGAKYAVTRDLDITGAYYHQNQNSFINGPAATSTNPTGTCTTAVSAGCSGQLDALSFVADWRFARHFDVYAGIMWTQAQNGLINGFLLATPGVNKISAYDPGVGLRYQF